MNKVLNSADLESFQRSFAGYLSQYKLSYYIADKSKNTSKANAVHASIIWIRQCVVEINKSKTITGSKELSDLLALISFIDILQEATEQIYRVLYNQKGFPDFEEKNCFKDKPEIYGHLCNREYFKEIRAIFGAHPVNVKDPKQVKRFADVPLVGNTNFTKLICVKCDFYTRLWTATPKDEDTIRFPIIIDDLKVYVQTLYGRINAHYIGRLKKIANKKLK